MLPTCEVALARSTYSSSRCPSSTRAMRHSSPSEMLISISLATVFCPLSWVRGHWGPGEPFAARVAVTSERSAHRGLDEWQRHGRMTEDGMTGDGVKVNRSGKGSWKFQERDYRGVATDAESEGS